MDWTRYRFHSRWALPAPPDRVYEALGRAEDYPRWWPQVREVGRVDDTTGVVRVRSALPYDLTFTVRAVRSDPAARVLEIALSGELDGWARWTVTADGPGAVARYEQAVRVDKPLLRRFAVPGRPLFRLNHRLMMRAGRRGLAAYLEAV
ncbi:SRPBCC family protein [Streptomyces sp. NBC_00704]|uniref:SRPBCC family protein n=1 Tax=Streptomyces sp. NBC_00704 TaxID=2975809 RepID=UPI002E3002BB|nr:SRPBCC family protein [Streptomyces sp. NBC_00704]